MAYQAVAGDFARGIAVLVLMLLTSMSFTLAYIHLARFLRGETRSVYDGARDERVSAGVAIDLKHNRWSSKARGGRNGPSR